MNSMIYTRPPKYWWENLTDEELLRVPLRELGLKVAGTAMEPLLQKLHKDLERRWLKVRPRVWVSTEWFCPDGFDGFAIPFYLFHPRLAGLYRKHGGTPEGCRKDNFLKILRHETGHLVDNAYGLRRSALRRKVFGLSSTPYPSQYEVQPYSKSYVRHLSHHYAQSHPDEDFAETFAVWLQPRTVWRAQYAKWPALKKLTLMDALLKEKRGQKPLRLAKGPISALEDVPWTLGGYLRKVQREECPAKNRFFERDLRALFIKEKASKVKATPAKEFLRATHRELTRSVARQTGLECYKVQSALKVMMRSCQEENLVLKFSKRETKAQLTKVLTERAQSFVRHGHHKILM